jgi:hypothetical protein
MDAGLLVVLAAVGVFMVLPLWFAWLSTDSRRWGRVQRVLGREPSGRDRGGLVGVWAGLSAAYLVNGAFHLLAGRPRWHALLWLLGGLLFAVMAGVLHWRRPRERAASTAAQVEGGPEAGRPGAGGGGGH